MVQRRKIFWAKLGALMLIAILWHGCARVVPKNMESSIDRNVGFQDLQNSPENYRGKMVVLGGRIIHARNTAEGTMLEMLQEPLDSYDRPKSEDEISEGRFMALYKGYLDTAIYQPGRQLTIIGTVSGAKKQTLDEIEYTYPYVEIVKIHLWREETDRYNNYFERNPYWWYYPYISPPVILQRKK